MPTPLWWFIKEGGKKTKAAQASGGSISETRFGTFFVPRIGDCSGWGFFPLVGPTHQDPSDSRGLCGGVLGRNDNRQGEPTKLLLRAGRPLGRWASQIVEREIGSRHLFSSNAILVRRNKILNVHEYGRQGLQLALRNFPV